MGLFKQKSKAQKGSKANAAAKESAAKRERLLSRNVEMRRATQEMSCVSRNKQFRPGQHVEPRAAVDNTPLREHLHAISPFNKRWYIDEVINEGTYGIVLCATDKETGVHGVIKVAKTSTAANQSTEWESFLLERIWRADEGASVVRLLDRGMLADQDGNGMEFVVLEKATISIPDYLSAPGIHFSLKACDIGIQMLKGIADMHRQGLLHRDLKPANMGIYSTEDPVVLIFDLGMARMYTDADGNLRPPRTIVPFRGTPEWATGHAMRGREQGRFDDILSWFYVITELVRPSRDPPNVWDYRSPRALAILKSAYAPASLVLGDLPEPFYAIYAYLMTANRRKPVNYIFLAERMRDARKDLQARPEVANASAGVEKARDDAERKTASKNTAKADAAE